METILSLQHVNYSYEDDNGELIPVLKDFSLEIQRGSFVCVLGHNGSGKSTLAKLLNGLYQPDQDSGPILVDGLDTRDEKNELEVRRRVGLVFQNPDNQLVTTVVEEEIAFGPENLGLPRDELRKRVDEALLAVDMQEYREHATYKLSGGQKQRIAIAGILAMRPQILILDEPTAMLDPKGREEVLSAVRRLNREQGMTVILITHHMEEAAKADRVIVMQNGQITADSTPQAVFSQPRLIRDAGLSLPQPTELMHRLIREGFQIDKEVLTVEQAVAAIGKMLKEK